MTADLSGIRSLLEGITPGPWVASNCGAECCVWVTAECDPEGQLAGVSGLANAAFIAAAPAAVERLLGIVERVEALHTFAHKDVEPWAKGYRFSGDHCAYDGEHWPCETIAAVTGEGA